MPTGEPWNAPGLDPQEAHHLREQDALARQTRVGAFLRRSGLDELPQLWNVLKGEMSLVGPRPEQTDLADQFAIGLQGYTERSRLPPGITGWAQVQGYRGDTDLAGRVRLDNDYIENWSLWRDVVILARTAGTIVRAAFERPGADRAEESR